jgi:DNA gyrase subunit A
MRYTEARLSPIAAMMLEDLKLDTVDFVPSYDERHTEPTVLPSKFPNLLVNGSGGIAVGMATSIPPHNLGEVCRGLIALIDDPGISIHDLMELIPGPDFPTGGAICGRTGIRRGYLTGRSTVVVRARTSIEEKGKRSRIVVHEIPFQQARDPVVKKIAQLVNEGKISGISDVRDESDLKEPVRLVIELKRDADPEIVLNQLFKFSPLQDSFSIILLALVDGKPRVLTLKEMLEEYLRHRFTVIRRRTQFLLARARKRKHTVQGLLLAHANIDEVIRVIRASKTQAEAKERLMQIRCPGALLRRALGDDGFAQFQQERGAAEEYGLTPVQADAILRMTLGQLVNLEQEKLAEEHAQLLAEIHEHLGLLAEPARIYAVIRDDCEMLVRKYADQRRTVISDEEVGEVDLEDLIEEETMVVSISHEGYVKRTPASAYRAQRRGGKGIKGAKADEDDPVVVFHQPGKGVLAEGLQLAGAVAGEQRPRGGQSAQSRGGRADCRLPRRARLRSARPLPDDGHPQRTGEEDAARGVPPPDEDGNHRHQASRRRRAGRRGRDQARRRSGAGHRERHGHSLQRSRRAAHGPQHERRERRHARQGRYAGRHGRGRSGGHPAHRLRPRVRQTDPLRTQCRR